MLGKLIKSEFKATARMFLPIYALVAVLTPLLALLTVLFGFRENSALSLITGLSMMGYVMLLIGAGVASFVLIITRFYQTMAKEHAYMTFMLPVKTSSLIFSKLLTAFIWQVISVIIIVISIAGFTMAHGLWGFDDLTKLFDLIKQLFNFAGEYQSKFLLTLGLWVGLMIVGTISGILQIYTSIALGQCVQKHRVLASFGFYFAIYLVMQIISSIAIMPYMFKVSATGMEVINYQVGIFSISLAVSALFSIIFFVLTNMMFKKHLNLE